MSGPSSGVIAMDELVKLGEMRVQHFSDHNNQRAGEIVFSVNIGDTNAQTVDVMSLTPEEVHVGTAVAVDGALSCQQVSFSTMDAKGNEFRNTVATFSHPLSNRQVTVSRDEHGGNMAIHGDLQSTDAVIERLRCDELRSTSVDATVCAVETLEVSPWRVVPQDGALVFTGPGDVRIDAITTGGVHTDSLQSTTAVTDSLSSQTCHSHVMTCVQLSVAEVIRSPGIACGPELQLPQSSRIRLGEDVTISVEDDALGISTASNRMLFSGRALHCAGLSCQDSHLRAESILTDGVEAGVMQSDSLSCSHMVASQVSSSSVQSDEMHARHLTCGQLRTDVCEISEEGVTFSIGAVDTSISDQGVRTSVLRGETTICGTLSVQTVCPLNSLSVGSASLMTLSVSNSSCEGMVVHTLSANSLLSEHVVTESLTLSSVEFSDQSGDLYISGGLVTGHSVLADRVHVNAMVLIHEQEELAVQWNGKSIELAAELSCVALTSEEANMLQVSCSRIHDLQAIETPHQLTLSCAGMRVGCVRLDDDGVAIDGEVPRFSLGPMVLSPNRIAVEDVLHISCSELRFPESRAELMSTETLRVMDIHAVDTHLQLHGNVRADAVTTGLLSSANLMASSISTSSLDASGTIRTRELKTDRIEGDASLARMLFPAGSSSVELHARDVTAMSDTTRTNLVLSNSLTRFTLCVADVVEIETPPVVIGNRLSCSGLDADLVTTGVLQSPGDEVRVDASLRVEGSCTVSEHMTTDFVTCASLSCGEMHTQVVHGLRDVRVSPFGVRFDNSSHLAILSDGVHIGPGPSASSRLVVHAPAFTDAIRITADDASMLRLVTSHGQARAIALDDEGSESSWMIGVGNLPHELENTFAIYQNQQPALSILPSQTLRSHYATIAPQLSTGALHLHDVLMFQDCEVTADGTVLTLDCSELQVPGAQFNLNSCTVTTVVTLSSGAGLNGRRIFDLASPVEDGDATNKLFVETRLEELFTEERVFMAPVYWAPPTQPELRSFSISLSEEGDQLGFRVRTGTQADRDSFGFTFGANDASQLELFPTRIVMHLPVEFRDEIRLPFHTITSTTTALGVDGDVRVSGALGVGADAQHALHVLSASDDDCALLQATAQRARTTTESIGDSADQAMFSCQVGSTVFSSGYIQSSDSFVIASSTDLQQNTHLVISRVDSAIRSAGDLVVSRVDGVIRIEEAGATTFEATRDRVRCQNFDLTFDTVNAAVDHNLGGTSILNLSSYGIRVAGATSVSESLQVKDTTFLQSATGEMTVNRKMSIPDVETGTLFVKDRSGFNLYQDDTSLVRFQDDGSALLMDFDAENESLSFSFPTLPNTRGRDHLFASDQPILELRKNSIAVDTNDHRAKFTVATESGPQLAIINPSNVSMHTDFTVDDSGEFYMASSQRKYNFDGDVFSENMTLTDYFYLGTTWRLGVSEAGSFIVQCQQGGAWVTKTEVSPD
jgi:hypothetical protein